MEKYPTIELQLTHMRTTKRIEITDEQVVKDFLKKIPYEKSIKEIKPLLLNFEGNSKYYTPMSWMKVEQQYYEINLLSQNLLKKIIEIENCIKSNLIYHLQEGARYKSYINTLPRYIIKNLKYYQNKYNIDDKQIKQYIIDEKFYLIVNAFGFNELIELVFDNIYRNDIELYKELIVDILEYCPELDKISNLDLRNYPIPQIFEKQFSVKNSTDQHNHQYYHQVLIKYQSEITEIAGYITKYVTEYIKQIDVEVKFTNSVPFQELKKNTEDLLNFVFSSSKFGDLLYIGDENIKSIIANYKDGSGLDYDNLMQVANICATSIMLFILTRQLEQENDTKYLLNLNSDDQLVLKLKQQTLDAKVHANLNKYLGIINEIRNSVAHGGTFVIPLFREYDSSLRIKFAEEYLTPELVRKIKQGRIYYRSNQ